MFQLPIFLSLLLFFCTPSQCQNKHVHLANGTYDKENIFDINNNMEYIISFPPAMRNNPFRITTTSIDADIAHPILVVVRQEKEVVSWQIPLIAKSNNELQTYWNISRTLCYNPEQNIRTFYRGVKDNFKTFSISLSTSSSVLVKVLIEVSEVKDYTIRDNINYTVTISPSQPAFYFYSFEKKDNKSNIFISIDSKDDICLTASVQNSLCPVRDLNKEIEFEGRFQAMTTKGGLMIPKYEYPNGFFLVFVAKINNYACSEKGVFLPSPRLPTNMIGLRRVTTVNFKIKESLPTSSYLTAVLITLGTYLGFCLLFVGIAFLTYRCGKLYKSAALREDCDEEDSAIPCDRKLYLDKSKIVLQDLAHYEKSNQKKSFNYLWHIIQVGIFYGIPVVQLMASYQRAVYNSGDQDICYHNLYCAHPLFGVTDFNHIFSNVGYVICGIIFLSIIAFRQKFLRPLRHYGISIHYGLYYSMGVALIIEGVMSACYHICPNQSNYQFDTSFMYVMAVLVTIKLYQNRHPDINASAYATFTFVGLAIFLAMIGILSGSVHVMIFFFICYVFLCIYLSFKIYFFGEVINGVRYFMNKIKNGSSLMSALKPIRTTHFLILLIFNICNYALASFGLFTYPNQTDFGTYLLTVLMGNAILHMTFYITMKLYVRESLCFESILYGLLAVLTWGSSGYFFFNNSTQWAVSPAESKQLNNECLILDFYDQHDIWHMLSAPALLFSFMLLMTIDDDLIDKSKEEINVF